MTHGLISIFMKNHCQFYTNNLHYKAPKAKQIASGVKLKIRGNGKIHIVMSCHYHMVMTFYHVAMKLPLPLPHGKITLLCGNEITLTIATW